MDAEIIERQRRGRQFALDRMPGVIDKIRYQRKPISLEGCYRGLSSNHLVLGIYDYFIDGNLPSFKQHLYTASRLKLAAIALDSYQTFGVGSEIFFGLFSDNAEIINAMARLETPELLKDRHNPLLSRFRVHMWQLAILGDYEALQAMVAKLAKNGRKGDRELAAAGQDFFSLLIRGDTQGLEDLIHQHALIKSEDPITEDFMSFLGCLECKICWLKGIPVQIENPLVPMELMPMKPLDHYDEYDFLQPDWVPLRESWLASMKRRLKYG